MPTRPDVSAQSSDAGRQMSVRVRCVLAALLALVWVAAPGPALAAAGDDTLGLGAAPARNGVADGRTRFSVVVGTGQRVEDSLLVRNTGTTDAEFLVYAADAHTSNDGAYALDETGTTPSGVGSWVTFDAGASPVKLDLSAGDQALVPFRVSVPAEAVPGDHAGGIVVSTGAVNGVERRIATRLYVRVPGLVQPALSVTGIAASQPLGGNPLAAPTTITATLANTGAVALSARLIAGAKTLFGATSGTPVERDIPELLPGETRPLTVTVDGVGRLGYVAPYLELTPLADPSAYDFAVSLETVHGETTLFAVPWLLLGMGVLLVAGALFLVPRRRAMVPREAAVEPSPTTVGERSS